MQIGAKLGVLWQYARLAWTMFYIFYPFIITTIITDIVRGRKHQVHYNWSKAVCNYFNLKIKNVGTQPKHDEGRVMYLFNHRSMADFFIHDTILEGTASFLSRYLVGMIFWTALLFYESIWFFKRGVQRDFKLFYEWLDKKFVLSNRKHLLVYPEGHRMQKSLKPGKLKYGMIKYAFARGITVQISICFGNDKACCENPPIVNRQGTDIFYSFDKPINPKQFETEEEFVKEVQNRFYNKFE